MNVEITAEAERDLEEIGDRIAQDNPVRALSFVVELRATCLGLAEFPERFSLAPRYEAHGVCHRVHGNYLIFYRVEQARVVVIHVRHGAMDYAGLLFDEWATSLSPSPTMWGKQPHGRHAGGMVERLLGKADGRGLSASPSIRPPTTASASPASP